MQNHLSVAHISAVPLAALFAKSSLLEVADVLPNIPTMVSTRLRLELLLQESSVDLTEMSEVILSDVGATLQILRLVGEDYPNEEDRPTRIEDCIVSLGRERWYDVVCASGMLHGGPLLTEWQRCRRVAEHARELARCIDGFAPEQAYLVGLLYELGKFPTLLGWNQTGKCLAEPNGRESAEECCALSIMLAQYWHLPKYLLAAIQESQQQQSFDAPSPWTNILRKAHQMADHTPGFSARAFA